MPAPPPAEDVDRLRRRFNMRMLVPGRPVKEVPATPPPVPAERPAYREKFIPPELSMWDYFVAKVRRDAAPHNITVYIRSLTNLLLVHTVIKTSK